MWRIILLREIRIDTRMNENAVLIDVHQRQLLDPPQVLVRKGPKGEVGYGERCGIPPSNVRFIEWRF
jgi:hypothetical protein